MNTLEDTVRNKIVIPCRDCGTLYEVDAAKFTEANDYRVGFRCVACNAKFVVRIAPLEPRTPTQRAADG